MRLPRSNPRPAANYHSFDFEAIGTQWHIDVGLEDNMEPSRLETAIHDRIGRFDAAYSRFRTDSLVSRMAHTAGTYTLPADARPLFDLYERLYAITDGAVTPLIGQTLADAGYDGGYSLTPKPLRPPEPWERVLLYDFPHLTLYRPALLDVGAAGKGYLVDLIGTQLEARGIHDYCIDAGGDIRHRTSSDTLLTVGLEHPDDVTQAVGIVRLGNQSVCGSAGNRRAWGAYHHILDPHTLQSPRHIQAVWVVADSTLLADGLSTALFFVTPAILKQHFSFEYMLIHADGAVNRSGGFPADLFVKQSNKKGA